MSNFWNMLQESLKDRVTSPFFINFLISWVFINWEALLIYFGSDIDLNISSRAELLHLYIENYGWAKLIAFPALFSLLITILLPFINLGFKEIILIAERVKKQRIELHNDKMATIIEQKTLNNMSQIMNLLAEERVVIDIRNRQGAVNMISTLERIKAGFIKNRNYTKTVNDSMEKIIEKLMTSSTDRIETKIQYPDLKGVSDASLNTHEFLIKLTQKNNISNRIFDPVGLHLEASYSTLFKTYVLFKKKDADEDEHLIKVLMPNGAGDDESIISQFKKLNITLMKTSGIQNNEIVEYEFDNFIKTFFSPE